MAKYAISIKEVLQKTVIVDADTLKDAISSIEQAYATCKIVLDYDDFCDVSVSASDQWRGGKVPNDADISCYWHL